MHSCPFPMHSVHGQEKTKWARVLLVQVAAVPLLFNVGSSFLAWGQASRTTISFSDCQERGSIPSKLGVMQSRIMDIIWKPGNSCRHCFDIARVVWLYTALEFVLFCANIKAIGNINEMRTISGDNLSWWLFSSGRKWLLHELGELPASHQADPGWLWTLIGVPQSCIFKGLVQYAGLCADFPARLCNVHK